MSMNRNHINAKNVLTISLIIFGVVFLYVNVTQLNELWLQVSFYYLCWAVFLAILAIILSAYKFKLTIDLSLNKDVLFKDWLQIFVKGYLLSNLIPYSGLAYRGMHLKKYYDVSYTHFVAVTYIFATFGLVLLLGASVFFLLMHHYFFLSILFLVFFLLAIRFKFYFLTKISRLSSKYKKINFYLKKFDTFDNQLKSIFNSERKFFFLFVFLSSLYIDFLVYSCVFLSIDPDVPWHLMLYVYLPYSLAWLIKITPANLGVQEFLMGGLTSVLGLGLISGVTLSVLLRFINLLGAFCAWTLNSIFKLRC